jgi:hypothetical protein
VRRYNGTDAYFKSLRKHNQSCKNRPDAHVSLAESLLTYQAEYQQQLKDSLHILNAKVVIYDTEYDGVGAGYEKERIREFYLYCCETGVCNLPNYINPF